MNTSDTLTIFAANFVKKDFRDRFLHEAMKKPAKIQARICHHIETLFPKHYKYGSVCLEADTPCLLLGSKSNFEETTWREASKRVGFGDGILVISCTGNQFYAETEGSPISEVWAGGIT